jgi:hypothetical protein
MGAASKEKQMKTQWLAAVLTVVNLILLVFMVTRVQPAVAEGAVLRGKELQIVDDSGRVRASIKLHPPNKTDKYPDGRVGSPETVMLRLIDENGRPFVKLGGSTEGSGFALAGDSEKRDWSGIQVLAEAKKSSVILTNRDGRKTTLAP